jgi:hypothetical protein
VSTRVIARSLSVTGVLGLLAASSALAQIGNTTIIASARATGTPSVSSSITTPSGQVRTNPDPQYTNTVRGMLANTDWVFLGNNTVLVVRETEVIMTLRMVPGFDGMSWQVSNAAAIGSAMYTVSGQVRRANGTGAADLMLTTVSAIGTRATSHVLVPLTFDTVPRNTTGLGGTGATAASTGAQGGVPGDFGTNSVSGNGTTPPNGVHQPPGWGVRLWPVPWG